MSLTPKKGHTTHKNGMGFQTEGAIKDFLVKPIEEELKRRRIKEGYKSLNESRDLYKKAWGKGKSKT